MNGWQRFVYALFPRLRLRPAIPPQVQERDAREAAQIDRDIYEMERKVEALRRRHGLDGDDVDWRPHTHR